MVGALPLSCILFFFCWLSAFTDGDVEETESEGTVGVWAGGWRIWGWPLLTRR